MQFAGNSNVYKKQQLWDEPKSLRVYKRPRDDSSDDEAHFNAQKVDLSDQIDANMHRKESPPNPPISA